MTNNALIIVINLNSFKSFVSVYTYFSYIVNPKC